MSSKSKLLIVGVVLAAGLVTTAYVANSHGDESTNEVLATNQVTDSVTGLALSYTAPLVSEQLTEADRTDKFIFRLTSQDPPMIVSVRYEDGIEPVAAIVSKDTLDLVISNALKALPTRFPGFELLSEQDTIVADKEAHEIMFRYDGPSGERAVQRLLILKKTRDLVVYIALQATADNFDSISQQYFAPLLATALFIEQ